MVAAGRAPQARCSAEVGRALQLSGVRVDYSTLLIRVRIAGAQL